MLTLLISLLGCASSREDDILALTGDTTNGGTVFAANCASCHGTDATGGSGPSIAGVAADEAVSIVLAGEEDMPAFDGEITDQEIADVLAYIESL